MMNIKKYGLKGVFLIGFIALLIQGFTKFDIKPKEKFIGLQLYSVREAMESDPKGTVTKVGEMGYKFVEAAGYNEGRFYGMTPTEFKELCEASGMKFLGSHTGQNVPNEDNWDSTMAWWDAAIEAHAEAGVKWIVQPWMNEVGYESLDGLKQYINYFNAVGEKCNKKGIRFGYHNHDKEFTTEFEGKPVYDWMLELTEPKNVMFELDLYWIDQGGKDALAYFDKYPGRFMLWHIKDKEELGASGQMDFNAVFAKKKKAGLKYGIVEVEEYNFEPMVSVKKSLDYMETTNY